VKPPSRQVLEKFAPSSSNLNPARPWKAICSRFLRDWLDRAALITERQVGEVAEGIEILVDDGLLGVALGLVLAAQLDDLAARRRVQIGALRLGADSADILGQFSWPRSTASAIDEIAQTVAVGGVDAVMADGGARRGWHRGFGPAGHGMHS
jgi:hypothetical protein